MYSKHTNIQTMRQGVKTNELLFRYLNFYPHFSYLCRYIEI
jgi:hypothetical protein